MKKIIKQCLLGLASTLLLGSQLQAAEEIPSSTNTLTQPKYEIQLSENNRYDALFEKLFSDDATANLLSDEDLHRILAENENSVRNKRSTSNDSNFLRVGYNYVWVTTKFQMNQRELRITISFDHLIPFLAITQYHEVRSLNTIHSIT